MDLNPNVLNRIENISWFTNCGREISKELFDSTYQVKSWADANKACSDLVWQNTHLEARNRLTEFLHSKYIEKYHKWNLYSKEARTFVIQTIQPKLLLVKQNHELSDQFVSSVMWDLVTAIMEDKYLSLKCGKPPIFSLKLLKIYEAGHFPCGWFGEWPSGKLMVF